MHNYVCCYILGVLLRGLPQLAPYSGSSSASHSTHSPAEKEPKCFQILERDLVPQIKDHSTLWGEIGELGWSSEAEIRDYMERVLRDIAREAGISHVVCKQESSLFDSKRAGICIRCAVSVFL